MENETAQNAANTVRSAAADARGTLGDMGDAVKDTAKKMGAQAAEAGAEAKNKLGEIGDSVKQATQKAGSQAAEAGDHIYRQAAETGRYVARQVEEQPFTSAMVLGGLGLLVGFLLGRGSVERARTWRDYADDYLPRKYRP